MVASRDRGTTGRRSLERIADPNYQRLSQPQIEADDFVGHAGYTYQVLSVEGDRASLKIPGTIYPGYVCMLGTALSLMPTHTTAPLEMLRISAKAPKPETPPLINGGSLQVGSVVRKGTSLSQWVILEVNCTKAKVRQRSGYAQRVVFECDLSELTPWKD